MNAEGISTKILTYNIWNYSGDWGRRRHALTCEIARTDADVVALQEVRHSWQDGPGRNQARWLAGQLNYRAYFRPAHTYWPLPPVVEGLAFLTKEEPQCLTWYPVPRFGGAGPGRAIFHMRIGGVDYYNVHFPLLERARTIEAAQLIDVVSHTSAGTAIALGDFNADSNQTPMRTLFGAGFTDLWSRLHDYGGGESGWPKRRRIDYILGIAEKPWHGSIRTVGDRPHGSVGYPSDHVGVLAELQL